MASVAKLGNYVVNLPEFAERKNAGIVVTAYADRSYCPGGAVAITAVDESDGEQSILISGLLADEWREAFEHPFPFAAGLASAV